MSITIIDKTKEPLPRYTRHEHPEKFKTTRDEDAYWDKEFERWENGIALTQDGERMPGMQYFWYQEIMIPSQEGGMIRPRWRDVDDLAYNAADFCANKCQDLEIGKRRGLGLTSIFGCAIPLYYALTIPNTRVPLTSDTKTKTESMLANIIKPAYANLHPYYRPQILYDRKEELTFGERINKTIVRDGKKVKVKEIAGMMTQILPRQTTTKPTAFESIRAKYGFIDELFLHPKAHRVRASMQMCFGSGLQKNGWMCFGGSAGDENPESLLIAQELWMNAEKLGIVTLFIPGTMGNEGNCSFTGRPFSINGWSQEDVAREYIERKLEELAQSTDLTEYRNFKHSMPLTVEDMFAIKTSDVFDPEVMDILTQQRQAILAKQPLVHIGEVEENKEGKLYFRTDRDKGKTKILDGYFPSDKEANIKNLHLGGIDPIPGNDPHEKGSDMAFVQMRRDTKKIVALRSERHPDVDMITRKIIPIQQYYHESQAMIEKNHGGVAMQTYREEGVYNKLLADSITAVENKYSKKKNKKGYSAGTQMNLYRHQLLVKYILQYGETIDFLDIIDDILKYARNENADLTDALTGALLADADWQQKEIKETAKPKIYKVPTIQIINGVTRQIYKEYRTNV